MELPYAARMQKQQKMLVQERLDLVLQELQTLNVTANGHPDLPPDTNSEIKDPNLPPDEDHELEESGLFADLDDEGDLRRRRYVLEGLLNTLRYKHPTDRRAKRAAEDFVSHGTLLILPKESAHTVLAGFPRAAEMFYKHLCQKPFGPPEYIHRLMDELIPTLCGLPGGSRLAFKYIMTLLCQNHTRSMWTWRTWEKDYSNPLAHALDKLALTVIISMEAANEVVEDVFTREHLIGSLQSIAWTLRSAVFDNGYVYGKSGRRLKRPAAAWVDRNMPDGGKALVEQHFLPLTRRYRTALALRSISDVAVPRICGHLLPEELMDIIKEFSYDKGLLERAAGLTSLSIREEDLVDHRRWAVGLESKSVR